MAEKPEKPTRFNGNGSTLISALYESRSDLPEYKRWQNALRPEDNGYSDGLANVPGASDPSSPFESMVLDQLKSRLGVVRNRFANDDAQMLSEIAPRKPDLLYFQRLVEEKRKALLRPVLVSMDKPIGQVSIGVATALAATLMAILWLDKGLETVTAVLVALFAAAIGAMLAYPCGLMLRQASLAWQKWLAAAVLLLVAGTAAVVCTNMRTPNFDGVERATIGLFVAFALLSVAAAAFMMNDQDAAYRSVEARYAELHHTLARLEVARIENHVFHTNVARRHVDLASQMISCYRQANKGARAAANPPPAFFHSSPALPEILDTWLTFLEVQQ